MSSDDPTTPLGTPQPPAAPQDATPTRTSPAPSLPARGTAPEAPAQAQAPGRSLRPDPEAPEPDRIASSPRTSTLVGALVLVLLGAGVVAVGVGARLDLQAALIALLVIAGTALLVGALLSARRGR